jgi:hypothetical protein
MSQRSFALGIGLGGGASRQAGEYYGDVALEGLLHGFVTVRRDLSGLSSRRGMTSAESVPDHRRNTADRGTAKDVT